MPALAPKKRRSSYFEAAVTVGVLYHQEPDGWWAESPYIEGWTVTGESYEEVRQLAEDGVTFARAAATPAVAERAGHRFPRGERAEMQAADRRAAAAVGERSARRELVAESLLRCPREGSRAGSLMRRTAQGALSLRET
jgi:hypothetical protein